MWLSQCRVVLVKHFHMANLFSLAKECVQWAILMHTQITTKKGIIPKSPGMLSWLQPTHFFEHVTMTTICIG